MIDRLYNIEKNKYITYNQCLSTQKNTPSVLFLHGLMSDMNGKKSQFLEKYCKSLNYNYITFDNFGHGKSSGNFIEETIGSWLEGVEMVLNALVPQPTVIVGSSMGAWLAILAARNWTSKVKAIVCIAAAVDFTEEVIWNKLPESHKKQMEQQQWLEIAGDCNNVFPISYRLIIEARKYLLLNNNNINLEMPVHLIHGALDTEVPYVLSHQIMEKIISKAVVMKLIKDGNHQLSRETDLAVIANSIEEVLSYEDSGNILLVNEEVVAETPL